MVWEELSIGIDGVAALATAAAAVFAAVQARHIVHDRRLDRQLETDGVVVAWRALKAPPRPGESEAVWKIEYSVINPGRFPITHIHIRIQFAGPVSRVHYDGSRDGLSDGIELRHAVLAGGDVQRWERSLQAPAGVIPVAGCSAVVDFREVDGTPHQNVWSDSPVRHGEPGA